MKIQSAKPCLEADDLQAIERVFASGDVADGEEIACFEAELAAAVGVPGSVAVSSGFAALHLTMHALGVGHGDEVVAPCVSTCPAMRNAIWACGAKAVYADVNIGDFNLSAESVRKAMTDRTKAILAPHHTGVPADVPALCALGVPVIEDCAQALGARWEGQPVGALGAASIFSFYATKLATSIDGGAICSIDAALLDRVRELRYYRHRLDPKMRFNYKMQNVHAALGRVQLGKLPRFLDRRRAIAARLREVFVEGGIAPEQFLHAGGGAALFKLAVRLPPAVRGRLLEEAGKRGIPCSTEFHWMAEVPEAHPNAKALMAEILTLPVYPALTDAEADWMVDGLRAALDAARAVLEENE